MLLRLKVRNFKNIEDEVVHFGPLTCFVGSNGAGKSNLFDAIQFLRALSEQDIQSAAQSIRSPATGSFGPRDLFLGGDISRTIEFEADLLVPREVEDDFGRRAEPATTLLRYELALRLVSPTAPRLEIAKESLASLKASEAREIIGFPHSSEFRKSVVKTTRRVGPLISTKEDGGVVKLMLHQDGGSRGRPIPAGQSPRTVVGGTNAAEYPTVLAARREMSSWQLLHLEPSVMRTPDQFGATARITVEGAHLASTLARLVGEEDRQGAVLQEATNRLMELVPEVQTVDLERDEVRQQIYVSVRMRGSEISMGPRALSDGTLRFLALVTLLLDPNACEVLCMEEPENGMHPARIPAAVELLRDFAVDSKIPVDLENPLRQVVVNTHSPDVVRQLSADQVLFVDALNGPSGRVARFSAIEDKWRRAVPTVPLQRMIDFIGGAPLGATATERQLSLRFGSAQ
jgi:predicted ATPase